MGDVKPVVNPVDVSGKKSPTDVATIQGMSQEAAVHTKKEMSKGLMGLIKIAAKHLPLVLGVYALGYFNFSVAWIVGLVGVSAATEQWRKEKYLRMSAARASSLYGDKEVIMSRVTDLPSWVCLIFLSK